MTETLRFGLIGRSDIKVGTGTFEVELADGRIITMSALDVGAILNDSTLYTAITGLAIVNLAPTGRLSLPAVTTRGHSLFGGLGPQSDVALYMGGAYTTTDLPNVVGFQMDTVLTPRDAGSVIRGVQLSPNLTTLSSGTHPDVVGIRLQPSVTDGGATIANYIGLHITTLTVPATTTEASAIQIQAPTGASTNYALRVVLGETLLQDTLSVRPTSGNTTVNIGLNTVANNAAFVTLTPSNSAINWKIEINSGAIGQAGAFQLLPSTVGGGATFTTPVLSAISTGIGIGSGVAASTSTALIVPAGSTSVSSLRVPHGSAPTSPVNGDIWTTTAGLFVRVNGVTVGPLS